jgi:hypothetical protein
MDSSSATRQTTKNDDIGQEQTKTVARKSERQNFHGKGGNNGEEKPQREEVVFTINTFVNQE